MSGGMTTQSLIIGLTGNIATGKSTILDFLARKGTQIIDADKLSHQAMEPGRPAYAAIVAEFGPAILAADGAVDRAALGRVAFANPDRLRRLEEIVHPWVFTLTQEAIRATPASVVVIEAVKLLEAGPMAAICDEIWVVTAQPEVQLQRLMEKRGMNEAAARARMEMQSPQAAKVNQAHRVIDNSGTLEYLYAQLDAIWQELTRLYPVRMAQLADTRR
jgi:dephospho-CoA kinase